MGWSYAHLHGFYMSRKRHEKEQPIIIQVPHPEWDAEHTRDERTERLADWFPSQLKQCVYTYDFGDSWDHTVLFERMVPVATAQKYPLCVAGKNACPPEDCGSTGGYERLLAVLRDPKNIDHEDMMDWMGLDEGETYDSTAFSAEEVRFADSKKELKEYMKYNHL